MNRQTNKHHRDIRLREPTNKREALKLALLCAITAPDHELKKREQCTQWAGKLAKELGDEVTKSVKAEVSAELNQQENEIDTETFEDGRRNCNWCGHELLLEQFKPALCSPCFMQYLEQKKERKQQKGTGK